MGKWDPNQGLLFMVLIFLHETEETLSGARMHWQSPCHNECKNSEQLTSLWTLSVYDMVPYRVLRFLKKCEKCEEPLIQTHLISMYQFVNFACLYESSGTKYPPYLSFSLYTNAKKLTSIQYSNSLDSHDEIRCLHGIRVLSTQWIVFGHICYFCGLFPVRNKGALTMVTDLHSKKEDCSNISKSQ